MHFRDRVFRIQFLKHYKVLYKFFKKAFETTLTNIQVNIIELLCVCEFGKVSKKARLSKGGTKEGAGRRKFMKESRIFILVTLLPLTFVP